MLDPALLDTIRRDVALRDVVATLAQKSAGGQRIISVAELEACLHQAGAHGRRDIVPLILESLGVLQRRKVVGSLRSRRSHAGWNIQKATSLINYRLNAPNQTGDQTVLHGPTAPTSVAARPDSAPPADHARAATPTTTA